MIKIEKVSNVDIEKERLRSLVRSANLISICISALESVEQTYVPLPKTRSKFNDIRAMSIKELKRFITSFEVRNARQNVINKRYTPLESLLVSKSQYAKTLLNTKFA